MLAGFVRRDGYCPGSIFAFLAVVGFERNILVADYRRKCMTDPEKVVTNTNVAGGSKLASRSDATLVSDGKRSLSDERRFQNALEDDEVRDALRVLRGTTSIPRGRAPRKPS